MPQGFARAAGPVPASAPGAAASSLSLARVIRSDLIEGDTGPRAAASNHFLARAAGLLAALVAGAALSSPALAQWDLKGSAGVRSVWADNVDYTSSGCRAQGTAPSPDPNTPPDPNAPPPDPNAPRAASCQSPDGDVAGDLRLTGTATRQGDRWSLNASYSPAGTSYRDRTELNRISHLARLRSEWRRSQRTRLYVNETFSYTPEQGTGSDNLSTAAVITQFSDRRDNRASAGLDHQLGTASRLNAEVEHGFQSYSDPNLVDYTGIGGSLRWSRDLSARAGFELTARAAQNRFRRGEPDPNAPPPDPNAPAPDPNAPPDLVTVRRGSETYSVGVGGRIGLGTRLSARGLVGFDLLVPDERDRSSNSGSRVQAALQWTGRAVNTEAGYNRQISTGSGLFADSWTQTWFSGTRVTFGRLLSGSLYANQSSSSETGGGTGAETVTRQGTANLDLQITQAFFAGVFFSRNVQWRTDEISHGRGRVDDRRFGLALTARFD